MKRKIAIVKVSSVDDRLIPSGLACLQAYLKLNDIPVKVYNFRSEDYMLPKIVKDPLIQLSPPNFIMNHQDFPLLLPIIDSAFLHSEISIDDPLFDDLLEDHAQRLCESSDITRKRYISIIRYTANTIIPKIQGRYDIIGFSLDYQNIVETTISSLFLKIINPEVKIIWGGPSITQSTEAFKLFLSRGVCDGLAIGEGEETLLDIAKGKRFNNIKGLMSINDNGEYVFKKRLLLNLDSLPTPDYTDLPLDSYYQIASVYRSRGCTNRCQFCAEWNLFGSKFRVRSVENVVKDVETILEKHNPQYIAFGESLVNDDLEYFEKLCDALIEKQFNVHFGTHFRANITPELARKAYKAGFNDAWVGFEAFSDEELKEMNKGTDVNQNMMTIKNLTEAGVNVLAMLVVGFSNIKEEIKNCSNIIETITFFSSQKVTNSQGKQVPLSIQWRPAPMFLVPGSFDYSQKRSTHTSSWKCLHVSSSNMERIRILQNELRHIPYEFERPIPNRKVGELMKSIQGADRDAGFRIGGIAQHVINFMMEDRRINRKKRSRERIGITAQRYAEKKLVQ
jgi:pyruvate-formate lyase-activating enzyme